MTEAGPGSGARDPWHVEGVTEATIAAVEAAAAASGMTPAAWVGMAVRRSANADRGVDASVRAIVQERIGRSEADVLSMLERLRGVVEQMANRIAGPDEARPPADRGVPE